MRQKESKNQNENSQTKSDGKRARGGREKQNFHDITIQMGWNGIKKGARSIERIHPSRYN